MMNMNRSPSRNGAVSPDGNLYQVGSMLFETVSIPGVTPPPTSATAARLQKGVLVNVETFTTTEPAAPPPVIRISLATTRTSESSSDSFSWRESSVMSLVGIGHIILHGHSRLTIYWNLSLPSSTRSHTLLGRSNCPHLR